MLVDIYGHLQEWERSVLFLFVEIPIDWNEFTVPQLKEFLQSDNIHFATNSKKKLIALCVANLPTRMKMEISGTAFAITPRRFISCHHCIFDEISSITLSSVVICSNVIKQGDGIIIPDPASELLHGDLHTYDANLDFAIFNLRDMGSLLIPIPVCPENLLPNNRTPGVITILYCAIGDFQVSEMSFLSVWRGGPYSILQYGHYVQLNDPPKCRLWLEHGLCRGSSGGAVVTNGHVAGMHLASLNQGRRVWRHVRGSTLAHSVCETLTDMQEIHTAYKESLVFCRVPAIMEAINNP